MRTHTVPALFDRILADFDSARPAPAPQVFRPAIDFYEYEDRFELVADLPGVCAGDVEVEFKEGVLHVQGARQAAELPKGARVHRRSRLAGRFQQRVVLGDEVDVDGIDASFADGVLTVRVPRSERTRPRQIPVSAN